MKNTAVVKKNIPKKLDPKNPQDRKVIIKWAVKRTVKEYGKALDKLSRE